LINCKDSDLSQLWIQIRIQEEINYGFSGSGST
jgi:hypothetical protein